MGMISNGRDEPGWVVAGWAFEGYLDHVLAEVREDPATALAVEQAIAVDGLHLQLQDRVTAECLCPVLVRGADEVISGVRLVRVAGRTLDDRSQEQFRGAVAELRTLFARWWPADVPSETDPL